MSDVHFEMVKSPARFDEEKWAYNAPIAVMYIKLFLLFTHGLAALFFSLRVGILVSVPIWVGYGMWFLLGMYAVKASGPYLTKCFDEHKTRIGVVSNPSILNILFPKIILAVIGLVVGVIMCTNEAFLLKRVDELWFPTGILTGPATDRPVEVVAKDNEAASVPQLVPPVVHPEDDPRLIRDKNDKVIGTRESDRDRDIRDGRNIDPRNYDINGNFIGAWGINNDPLSHQPIGTIGNQLRTTQQLQTTQQLNHLNDNFRRGSNVINYPDRDANGNIITPLINKRLLGKTSAPEKEGDDINEAAADRNLLPEDNSVPGMVDERPTMTVQNSVGMFVGLIIMWVLVTLHVMLLRTNQAAYGALSAMLLGGILCVTFADRDMGCFLFCFFATLASAIAHGGSLRALIRDWSFMYREEKIWRTIENVAILGVVLMAANPIARCWTHHAPFTGGKTCVTLSDRPPFFRMIQHELMFYVGCVFMLIPLMRTRLIFLEYSRNITIFDRRYAALGRAGDVARSRFLYPPLRRNGMAAPGSIEAEQERINEKLLEEMGDGHDNAEGDEQDDPFRQKTSQNKDRRLNIRVKDLTVCNDPALHPAPTLINPVSKKAAKNVVTVPNPRQYQRRKSLEPKRRKNFLFQSFGEDCLLQPCGMKLRHQDDENYADDETFPGARGTGTPEDEPDVVQTAEGGEKYVLRRARTVSSRPEKPKQHPGPKQQKKQHHRSGSNESFMDEMKEMSASGTTDNVSPKGADLKKGIAASMAARTSFSAGSSKDSLGNASDSLGLGPVGLDKYNANGQYQHEKKELNRQDDIRSLSSRSSLRSSRSTRSTSKLSSASDVNSKSVPNISKEGNLNLSREASKAEFSDQRDETGGARPSNNFHHLSWPDSAGTSPGPSNNASTATNENRPSKANNWNRPIRKWNAAGSRTGSKRGSMRSVDSNIGSNTKSPGPRRSESPAASEQWDTSPQPSPQASAQGSAGSKASNAQRVEKNVFSKPPSPLYDSDDGDSKSGRGRARQTSPSQSGPARRWAARETSPLRLESSPASELSITSRSGRTSRTDVLGATRGGSNTKCKSNEGIHRKAKSRTASETSATPLLTGGATGQSGLRVGHIANVRKGENVNDEDASDSIHESLSGDYQSDSINNSINKSINNLSPECTGGSAGDHDNQITKQTNSDGSKFRSLRDMVTSNLDEAHDRMRSSPLNRMRRSPMRKKSRSEMPDNRENSEKKSKRRSRVASGASTATDHDPGDVELALTKSK